VAHALTVFAWEQAAATADLTCTLVDVNRLWDVLESTSTPTISRSSAQHCLIDAWVDAVAAERGTPGVDPLSGLHTAGYLYGRVHELDRLSGADPTALLLLVLRWDSPTGPWVRIARILQIAVIMRAKIRLNATLCQVGTTMAIALVPDDAQARIERTALTKAVETGELCAAHVQVDVFAVPDSRSQLPELVTQLHGQANVDLAIKPPRMG
jgi:hypothetical protein